MSKACTSPTARLFQNSRLFSIPKPLPSAVRPDTQASGLKRNSDTATDPYPTHQAINSPHSSRAVGEWGLKRHLPLRTTTRSTTPIRILAQDTNDHVTDFASAGDHTVSLEKFQELGIPLVTRSHKQSSYSVRKNPSVYEDALDNTDRSEPGQRWRNNGPYLLSMGAKDMDRFLDEVETRRTEWLEYLREYFAQRDFDATKKESLDRTGFFGPAHLQPLNMRAEYILQEAQIAAKGADPSPSSMEAPQPQAEENQGEPDSTEAAQQQAEEGRAEPDSMKAARRQADESRAELHAQTTKAGAVEQLREADQRVSSIMTYAHQKMREAEGELPTGGQQRQTQIERIEAEFRDTQEDVDGIMKAAYEDVINTLGVMPEDTSIANLESYARKLVDEVVTSTAAKEQAREQALKQWEENEKKAHFYPDAQQLETLQKQLRDGHRKQKTRSELSSVLVRFLDLPGMGETDARSARHDRAAGLARTTSLQESLLQHGLMDTSPNDKQVPASTHPGAGLGYLRASVHMDNHPVYGPQAQRSAVLARVLKARASVTGTDFRAKLGVAGFVALDPKASSVNTVRNLQSLEATDRMAAAIDPYLVGGNKIYMQADSAELNEAGYVTLNVTRSDKEAIAVKTGDVQVILDDKKTTMTGTTFSGMAGSLFGLPDPRLPQANYGTGISNPRAPTRA